MPHENGCMLRTTHPISSHSAHDILARDMSAVTEQQTHKHTNRQYFDFNNWCKFLKSKSGMIENRNYHYLRIINKEFLKYGVSKTLQKIMRLTGKKKLC